MSRIVALPLMLTDAHRQPQTNMVIARLEPCVLPLVIALPVPDKAGQGVVA